MKRFVKRLTTGSGAAVVAAAVLVTGVAPAPAANGRRYARAVEGTPSSMAHACLPAFCFRSGLRRDGYTGHARLRSRRGRTRRRDRRPPPLGDLRPTTLGGDYPAAAPAQCRQGQLSNSRTSGPTVDPFSGSSHQHPPDMQVHVFVGKCLVRAIFCDPMTRGDYAGGFPGRKGVWGSSPHSSTLAKPLIRGTFWSGVFCFTGRESSGLSHLRSCEHGRGDRQAPRYPEPMNRRRPVVRAHG